MIQVVHFQRRQRATGNFSIESYFEAIRNLQPQDIAVTKKEVSFFSNGFFKRLLIALEAFFNQKDVNHITGDIHFANLFFKKKRSILTIHDCGALKNKTGWKKQIIKSFWFTLPAKKANYITVNSNFTKQDLLQYISFPEEKIKVIYIFVPQIHQAVPKIFNKAKPTILQLGTAQNKNIARTAQALQGINCRYVIVGTLDQATRNILIDNNIEFENITQALTDSAIARLYQESDMVALVSTLEGFGMPIVEANTTGRVVITSNTSSMPEIAGNAACLVNPFDVEDIRRGFLKLIEDDAYRAQLITNGFENAKRFHQQTIAHQYFDLYRTVATA
ncbi:MAG: glycosyltransferase family 4 protein [Chitinophagaceae bacterium]|nr:glycosyltransferase family 4 protein [Chitinophagaceae bacterium]